MATIFALITIIFIIFTNSNSQPYQSIYDFNCDSSPAGWFITGTVEVVANHCPNNTQCWDLRASSMATKIIPTSGHHNIKIILDLRVNINNGESCTLEYSIDQINYNITANWTAGAADLINSELILSDIANINNASNFQLRLSNTGTHSIQDHCYWDNIQLWGIPYTTSPTIHPTRYPTIYPTMNPSINPTTQSLLNPSKSPTPSPILVIILTNNPTVVTIQDLESTETFELSTTALSVTEKDDGSIHFINIVIVGVFAAVTVCMFAVGVFLFYRNRNRKETGKHQSFLADNNHRIGDATLEKVDMDKKVIHVPIQMRDMRAVGLTPTQLEMKEDHEDTVHIDDDDLDIIDDIITKGGPDQTENVIDADVAFSAMIADDTLAQELVMDDILQEMDATPGNIDNIVVQP